jgi:hypothetical protein
MKNPENALRLGPLPRSATVKLALTLPIELKEMLDRYATVHSEENNETVDAAALIPHMLEVFMARDRAFRKLERSVTDRSSIARAQA